MMEVVIERRTDCYCGSVASVTVDGEALTDMKMGTSRSIWSNYKDIVVKVDMGTPQAQREASVWLRATPEQRQYIATLLAVGPDYVVQEYVPLEKHHNERDVIREQALALFKELDLMWDWQDWNQFGIDERTGFLCVHDYCADDMDGPADGHHWTTLRRIA
jgi:hypothetical protein